jgi:peptidoglycan L-alanyl-D-glutamate endopeptidase CwlK
MSVKLEDLKPEVRELALAFVSALEEAGIAYVVTSTLRTVDEQVALYAQGRAPLDIVNLLRGKANMPHISAGENTYTVTKCDGVTKRSNHQGGRALDVVPMVGHRPTWDYAKHAGEFKEIGAIGKAAGFRWGGEWPPLDEVTGLGFDSPHFEA